MSAKNVGESVKAKLAKIARERGIDAQALQRRYVLERLLYRLSVSQHADSFCLKGGLLVALWNDGDVFRPTNDLDLNGSQKGDIDALRQVICDVVKVEVEDDGVVFDVDKIKASKVREGFIPGGKLVFDARVHTSLVRVRVDVGFGNAVTPEARLIEYPSLLGLPKPLVLAYPLETVVAEKLHAMVQHGLLNSRLKDYYDLWALSERVNVDPCAVGVAIRRTFEVQGTDIPEDVPSGLTEDFVRRNESKWQDYVASEYLALTPPGLSDVVERIRSVALPALETARVPAPAPGV